MSALWRSSLTRLTEHFGRIGLDDPFLDATIHEEPEFYRSSTIPPRPRLPGPRRVGMKNVFFSSSFEYRPAKHVCDANGCVRFTDKPWYTKFGAKLTNSAGEAFDFDPGANRSLEVFGHTDTFGKFQGVAEQAGEAVRGIPADLWKGLIPLETMRIPDAFRRWVFILFDLAWLRVPGSSLSAKKSTVADLPGVIINAHVSLEDFPKLFAAWGAPSKPQPLPPYWFSIIGNLGGASAAAIDILTSECGKIAVNGEKSDRPTEGPQPEQSPSTSDSQVGYLSASELAAKHKIPMKNRRAVEKALERWRLKNAMSRNFVEHDSRAKNKPKYLYREAAVIELVRKFRDAA